MDQNTQSQDTFSISFSKQTMMQVLIVINLALLVVYGFQIASIKSSLEGGGAKVAAAGNAAPTRNPAPAPAGNQPAGEVVPPGEGDYFKGDKNATITIIEYSDFDCPFCQRFHPTAQQAVDTYDGEVNWVYRHFPLNIHPNAAKKAEAAECAGSLGGDKGYWDFVDAMFEAGTNIPLTQLASIASGVGLNESRFQSCLDSGEQKTNVDADFASGQAAGVTGTPGSVIYNNETGENVFLKGALPFSQVQAAINQLL